MAKIEDLKLRVVDLADYVKKRKSITEVVLEALEDYDLLLFDSVCSDLDKDNTMLSVRRLWRAAEAQANASSVKPTRKKIEFVLDSIRYCQDCLRLKIKLRSRFTFGQALFQLKREQIPLRDVIALFIFEHQDIAQQTEQQLLKKLDDLLITQDMMRKFTEENASY